MKSCQLSDAVAVQRKDRQKITKCFHLFCELEENNKVERTKTFVKQKNGPKINRLIFPLAIVTRRKDSLTGIDAQRKDV